MEEAAVEYFEVPARSSRDLLSPEHSLALARWLVTNGHPEAALAVARRHLRDRPDGPGVAEANVIAGQALLGSGQPAPAYQFFRAALEAAPDPATAAAAADGVAAVEALQKRQIGRLRAPRP
jgi:uncharacterized protein HemY